MSAHDIGTGVAQPPGLALTVVGSGDAFGSGGRLQTCFHVATPDRRFLIDCGATVMIGLERCGLDANAVDTIFITHLHGDHFSGLVWWMLHGQHIAKRTAPLTVVGPIGIAARFKAAAEALFPGSTGVKARFAMTFLELTERTPLAVGDIVVTPYEVVHPSGAPSYALRFAVAGRTIVYSGDTEWVDALVEASRDADLFITECFTFDSDPRYHIGWRRLERELPRLTATRLLLTHMGKGMLARTAEITDARVAIAADGLVVTV